MSRRDLDAGIGRDIGKCARPALEGFDIAARGHRAGIIDNQPQPSGVVGGGDQLWSIFAAIERLYDRHGITGKCPNLYQVVDLIVIAQNNYSLRSLAHEDLVFTIIIEIGNAHLGAETGTGDDGRADIQSELLFASHIDG